MAVRTSFWLMRPSLVKAFWAHVRLAFRLVREPRVRWWCKAVPVAAMVYVLSPVDVLPDIVPVLGQLDDVGLLAAALEAFLRLVPSDAAAYHRSALDRGQRFSPMPPTGTVIDAEFRRE